ncbi:MAG: autotransporter outer membrane beta-barrel domain-containing protein [Desulfobulbaceae bacterium]|nr:autotransporter outer membrane beta-barrel domain-containing protein [Desulfobulbaceae bacterium]
MLSCAISISFASQANAAWDTGGVIPNDLLIIYNGLTEAEKVVAEETASPSTLGSGISAGINVTSGVSSSTTLNRMAALRSESVYAKLGYTPVGPAGNTSTSNILRSPGSWGKAYGTWGDQDDIDNDAGFEYDVVGVMLGYDVQSHPNWLFGMNAGYSYTDLDSGVNTNTDIDTINVGLYASYSKGQMYVDYGIMYSNGDIENDRTIILGASRIAANSDTSSDTWTGYIEAGQQYPFSNYVLTPYIGAMYSKVEVDNYGEKASAWSSALLIVDEVDDEFYSTTLGVKAEYFIDNILHLKGRLSWTHEFSDDLESSTNARFNSVGSSYFNTDGIDLDDDRFGIGIGMKYQYSPEITFDLDYDLELAEDFDSHTGTIGMKYQF